MKLFSGQPLYRPWFFGQIGPTILKRPGARRWRLNRRLEAKTLNQPVLVVESVKFFQIRSTCRLPPHSTAPAIKTPELINRTTCPYVLDGPMDSCSKRGI